MSEAWLPKPLAPSAPGQCWHGDVWPSWVQKAAPENHLLSAQAPPSHSPCLREWGREGGLCLCPRFLEESFPSPPGPPRSSISPSMSELQPMTRPSALQQRLAVVVMASLWGGRFTVGLDDAYVCVCMHMSVHLYMYTCAPAHVHVCTHVCTCTHTYMCVHVCVCAYACSPVGGKSAFAGTAILKQIELQKWSHFLVTQMKI